MQFYLVWLFHTWTCQANLCVTIALSNISVVQLGVLMRSSSLPPARLRVSLFPCFACCVLCSYCMLLQHCTDACCGIGAGVDKDHMHHVHSHYQVLACQGNLGQFQGVWQIQTCIFLKQIIVSMQHFMELICQFLLEHFVFPPSFAEPCALPKLLYQNKETCTWSSWEKHVSKSNKHNIL